MKITYSKAIKLYMSVEDAIVAKEERTNIYKTRGETKFISAKSSPRYEDLSLNRLAKNGDKNHLGISCGKDLEHKYRTLKFFERWV